MTVKDVFKAAGIALLLLVINFVIAILVVAFYSIAIEPGHPSEFYTEAANKIVPWAIHIVSPILFFATGYLFAARRPRRNAVIFAAAFSVIYAIIDAALVGFAFSLQFLASLVANLVASLVGAYLGGRKTITSPE